MVDKRFRQATGHSILDEIQSVRLERAKLLLLNPNQQPKSISDFCGLKSPNSLRKFFFKETGMTLTDWRKKNRDFTNAQNPDRFHDSGSPQQV